MALVTQAFTHALPGVPALTRGMRLGASGVSHAPLHTIGNMSGGFSAANGNFWDQVGKGQVASDALGRLFVADTQNNRVQCFTPVDGVFNYTSLCTMANALGANVTCELVAIDLVRDEIHIASSAQNVTNTWIGVWPLALFPNLTVGNRNRSYGTNSAGSASGRARAGLALTLVGDFAYVCSSTGDYRVLKWNHTNNTLIAEATKTLWENRLASDGITLYASAQASNTEIGLWRMNDATLVAIGGSRLDQSTPAGGHIDRRDHLVQGAGGDVTDIIHYNNRIYAKMLTGGRIQAWSTLTNLFVDEFLWGGGAANDESYGHSSGRNSIQAQWDKIGIALGASASFADYFVAWSHNAQNGNSQSFLTLWPLTTSTATWTKTDWSAANSTLKAIALQGTNLSGEKVRVRLRKNAEAWVTLTLAQLADAAALAAIGTFTADDELTFELSLSTWDRLDGHAELVATRDKLTPTNVSALLLIDDPASDVYVPQPVSAFTARLGGIAAFKARLGA